MSARVLYRRFGYRLGCGDPYFGSKSAFAICGDWSSLSLGRRMGSRQSEPATGTSHEANLPHFFELDELDNAALQSPDQRISKPRVDHTLWVGIDGCMLICKEAQIFSKRGKI